MLHESDSVTVLTTMANFSNRTPFDNIYDKKNAGILTSHLKALAVN